MSLKSWTPCDEVSWDGHHHCPYADEGCEPNCEYWCGFDDDEDSGEVFRAEMDAEYERQIAENEALWWKIRGQIEREYPDAGEQEVIDMTEFRWLKETGNL